MKIIHLLQTCSESGLAKVVSDPLLALGCDYVSDLVQFNLSALFDTTDHEMH